jgi:hypothetical protein
MARKKISLRPRKAGGKIVSVKVGPKWTDIRIRLSTKRLNIQTGRKTKS